MALCKNNDRIDLEPETNWTATTIGKVTKLSPHCNIVTKQQHGLSVQQMVGLHSGRSRSHHPSQTHGLRLCCGHGDL